MNKTTRLIFIFASFFGASAILFLPQLRTLFSARNSTNQQENLQSVANTTILALKNKDMEKIKDLVGTDGSLVVKPYYTPSDDMGVVLPYAQISSLLDTKVVKTWGVFDGSGLPMDLTGYDYYHRFIYSKYFESTAKISYNISLVNGNTLPLNTVLSELFPGKTVEYAEYHIAGSDEEYGGMDWESLALVFEKTESGYKLIGILHNEWTI